MTPAASTRATVGQAFLAFLCGVLLFGGYAALNVGGSRNADAWLADFAVDGGSLGIIVAGVFLLARGLERRFTLLHFPALLLSGLACSSLLHFYRDGLGGNDSGWPSVAIIGLILACTAYVPTLFRRPAPPLSPNVEP